MTDPVNPAENLVLTHFIVSEDIERSTRFYTEVLGGETIRAGEPTYVALANSWIIINSGGGPTDDKPQVILETPQDPNRVSAFLNIRVADLQTVYEEWTRRGAEFITPPTHRPTELRCYLRDPDGHLIEVGQTITDSGWRPSSGHLAKSARAAAAARGG
jgi:predicted enzyme related to lactoylglutathione lyase